MKAVTSPEVTVSDIGASCRLLRLSAQDEQLWDELIEPFASREVFHSSAWLSHLVETQKISISRWRIESGSGIAGYFCAGVMKKGPFKILGSPLQGWATNFMGPIRNSDVSDESFLSAVDDLAQAENLAMVELEWPDMDEAVLRQAGYNAVERWTYRVPLSSNHDEMLARMSKGRRYGIKKAQKAGLQVEEANNLEVADEFYSQFKSLMGSKKAVPSYGANVPRSLITNVCSRGKLFALRVRDDAGRVLATGFFPCDNRTLYYWGGASSMEGRELCPNDLIHWHAMCMGAARGATTYDLSGWGRFKKEFGGELITTRRWHKIYKPSAKLARKAYELFHNTKLNLLRLTAGK